MKIKLAQLMLILGALLPAGCGKPGDAADPAPPDAASHTNAFKAAEYYPAPNQMKMRTRMSGVDAQPLAGGQLLVKQLEIETFDAKGRLQIVVNAPECVYDTQNRTANSAGHLQLRSGDGKIRTDGDGFLWRQDDSSLTISNHVDSVVKTSAWKLNLP